MTDRPRPSPEQLQRYADEFNNSASMKHFGVRVSFPDGLRVRVDLDVRDHHRGGLGSDAVNGGVLAAMFDLAIGCSPALLDPSRRTATMQLSMSFMQASRGDALVAEAWIDSAGSSTLFASAHIKDAHGKVCAKCQGVVKVSKLAWANGSSPAVN